MIKVTSDIVIRATPDRVWRTLIDFPRFRDWHPFLELDGVAEQDATVDYWFRLNPTGPRQWTARALIKQLEAPQALMLALGMPGILWIEERFELAATTGGTLVTHSANFRGIIPFLLPRKFIQRRALPIYRTPIEWLAQYFSSPTLQAKTTKMPP